MTRYRTAPQRALARGLVWAAMALVLGAIGCKGEADCRQASATCADGFTCAEADGKWSCTPQAGATGEAKAGPSEAKGEAKGEAKATGGKAQAPPGKAQAPGLSESERKRLTREAKMNIRKLFDSSVSYYTAEFATRSGQILPRQFPNSVGLTPGNAPTCRDGRPVPFKADPSTWSNAAWQSLNFAIDGKHYYRYEYVSKNTGQASAFTARAIGDLDCDGIYSTFERIGTVDAENNVTGGAGLFVNRALE